MRHVSASKAYGRETRLVREVTRSFFFKSREQNRSVAKGMQAFQSLRALGNRRTRFPPLPSSRRLISNTNSQLHDQDSTSTHLFIIMAPVKKEKAEISDFERKRLENIAANQAILKDLSSTAERIVPKPVAKPKKSAPRKRAAVVKKEEPRPTRTSSRLAGVEADSETAKRKAEVEHEFAKEQAKAKRQRVAGDLNFSDIVVDGKFSKDGNFLSGIMRGAMPNVRTFTEDDIKETTDEGLKALREKMSGLEIYQGYEPNRRYLEPVENYELTLQKLK